MTSAPPDLLRRYERLSAPLVSDCAEEAGLGPRCAREGLLPFPHDADRVVVGWAHTALVRKTSDRVDIDGLLSMVEATPPDSIVVVAVDEDVHGALWGGLMSTAVAARDGRGAVVDGGIRDLQQVVASGFPVDIRGRGEVVGHGEPVVFRGQQVAPGDLVVADANGVVLVPRHAVVGVLELCERRLGLERQTEQELADGADPRAVYSRHGAF